MDLFQIARVLLMIGFVLIILSGVIFVIAKLGIPLGHLPGDIRVEGSGMSCVFALGTSILLSIILTVILNVIAKLIK